MVSLVWIDKNTLVAGGHDCVPVNFLLDAEDNITLGTKFEEEQHNEEDTGTPVAAMMLFKAKDRTGELSAVSYKLSTTHQKQITQLRIVNSDLVSSSGADGRICLWNLQSAVGEKMQNLSTC